MKKKPMTIHLKADTSELDEVQEKLDELYIALTRVNILMEELADKKIEVYDPLKSAGRTPKKSNLLSISLATK